jgi:hypothetical protein
MYWVARKIEEPQGIVLKRSNNEIAKRFFKFHTSRAIFPGSLKLLVLRCSSSSLGIFFTRSTTVAQLTLFPFNISFKESY